LKGVVDFLYNGEAYMAQQELNNFLETAQALKVKGLQSNDNDCNGSQGVDNTKTAPKLMQLDTQYNSSNQHINHPGTIFEPVEELADGFDNSEVALVQMEEDKLVLDTNIGIDLQIEKMIEKNEGMWQCKVCGKTAETSMQKKNFKRHVENHIEGVSQTSNICSKTLSNRHSLSSHVANAHTNLSFTCDICDKSGMTRRAFNNHKQRIHKV
jgi:hypothetical protein